MLWVFVCSFNFSVSFPATTPRATTPHRSLFSVYHAEGYHARTDTFKLTGYHVCRIITPELPRSIQTSGIGGLSHLRVVFSYFSFHRLIRQCFHNNNNTFPPSLAHTARTHSTTGMPMFHEFPTVRTCKMRRSRVTPRETTGSRYPL